MGFYFRRSISLGGFRLNFSKSGLGISTGLKGLRFGMGPAGNYIHAGRGGFYYKKNFSKSQSSSSDFISCDTPSLSDTSLSFESDYLNIAQAIKNNKHKCIFFPLALLLFFIPKIGIFCAITAALLIFFLVDHKVKKVSVTYDTTNPDDYLDWRVALCEFVECSKTWSVIETEEQILQKEIKVSFAPPKEISTNVDVLRMHIGRGRLYFFPDFILLFEGKNVSCINYEKIIFEQKNTNIVQTDGSVPCDGEILSYTWKYVTKTGEPDKRYSNNHQYPILLYSILSITSTTGLCLQVMFSRPNIGNKIIDLLKKQNNCMSNDTSNMINDDNGTNNFSFTAKEEINTSNEQEKNLSDCSEEDTATFFYDKSEIDPLVQKYMRPEDNYLVIKVLEVVLLERKASISYIQRRLKIGYNLASELIDLLEERGIVGPPVGAGNKREILVFDDIFDGIFNDSKNNFHSYKYSDSYNKSNYDYNETSYNSFDDNFESSDQANNTYSETIDVINSLLLPNDDEKMPYAIIYAIYNEKVSVKELHKDLKIGSARASKLIDQMEARGMLGHPYYSDDGVVCRKSNIFNYTDIKNPPPEYNNRQKSQEKNSQFESEGKTAYPQTDYYEILGVSSTATGAEIKKAWRKKVQEFHPDKIQGSGLSQSFMDFASEKLRTINKAYEEICKIRTDCR